MAPNPAHHALAKLAEAWPGKVTIVTQNVDDLHDRAGARLEAEGHENYRLIHMHGELTKARCLETGHVTDWRGPIARETQCPCCLEPDNLRPHIVWFGEMPLRMDEIDQALRECALFLSIGTSGKVYPAAGFVQQVRAYGRAHTVELNLEPSLGRSLFAEAIHGRASEIVSAYVMRILAGEVMTRKEPRL